MLSSYLIWQVLNLLRKAMRGAGGVEASRLLLATDPDREGEAIAWHVLELLQRQSSAGREEQLECVTFLQQRAQADAQYATSITKQRLGRRPVAELSDLRSTLMAASRHLKSGKLIICVDKWGSMRAF